MKNEIAPMVKIEDKLMLVRNQYVLLDRDVELNFVVAKLKHTVRKIRKAKG